MHLSQFFSADAVLLDLHPRDKWELIEALLDSLLKLPALAGGQGVSRERLVEALRAREVRPPTAIGQGVAFPHARVPGLQRSVIGLALLKSPLDFEAPDGRPVNIALLVLTPAEDPARMTKVTAQLARLLLDGQVRGALLAAKTPREALDCIEKAQLAAGTPIVAREIMRPPAASVGPDTALGEIAGLMSAKQISVLPVVDEKQEVLGEITSDRLLQLGLPDFFSQLKSVGFIREFDPFEKYFHQEARLKARDVMSADIALLPPETTLIEMIFALTVQHHPMVYVAEGRKLLGVVDQSVVLDEVINI